MKLEALEQEKYYHIYNRGINGNTIFFSNDNKSYFLSKLKKYLENKVEILAYCLLSNHFHLIVKIITKPSIATQSFSNLFNAYAKAINKQQKRTGSLFEKHFKRIELKNEKYLQNLILYVHLNPMKHFNIDFESYKYSSYPSILSDKPTTLKRNDVLQIFDGKENFKYVHQQKNLEIEEKFKLE